MTTYFENYLIAFINALTNIFEELNLNTDYLKDRDFTENTFYTDIVETETVLLEECGIDYLNTYNQMAADAFNSLVLNEKEFCKTYKGSSEDRQEATVCLIIFHLMQNITHISPSDFAFRLMNIGFSQKNPYKVRMLLIALDEAKKENRCA